MEGVPRSVRTVSVMEKAADPVVKRRGLSLLSDHKIGHFLDPTGLWGHL